MMGMGEKKAHAELDDCFSFTYRFCIEQTTLLHTPRL